MKGPKFRMIFTREELEWIETALQTHIGWVCGDPEAEAEVRELEALRARFLEALQ